MRLIALLKVIAESGQGLSLKELAAKSGLPPSTVHRLLQVLVRSAMVERGSHQSYRAGRELHRIASLVRAQFDLVSITRPHIEKLWSDWQETTVLCLYNPSDRTASIADAVLTPHPLRHAIEIGMKLALPWGSLGRSMLAMLPENEVDAVLKSESLGPLSGRPVPPRAEIAAELDRIRDQGFADYLDPDYDVAGIAAALTGEDGQLVGCIGVTMPSQRYQMHDRQALAFAIRDISKALSERIALQS
jgi:DNA-binding IclR family transcriptional regulator